MNKSARKILGGVLLALAAINAMLFFWAIRPPVHVKVVSRHPAMRIQFANDTGREMNFFYYVEVKSNGMWRSTSPQPKGARGANGLKPRSVREFEIAPTPDQESDWRVGFSYQAAVVPKYFEWAKRFGLLKNYREHYFDFKTVYTESLNDG